MKPLRPMAFLIIAGLAASLVLIRDTPALAAGSTLWVNDDGVPMPPGTSCEHPGFNTIQAAVSAATPGDRINVCAGTYVEQVTIPSGKDGIVLKSIPYWQAIIKAPPVMLDPKAIVRVSESQDVTIVAFTIAGPGGGPCDSLRYGVRVDNGGSANILGNHITQIRDEPFSGCQNGVAVVVGRNADTITPPDITTGTARVIGNVIDNYQKNGPTVSNVGSFAEIAHNRIISVGPTALIASNGIQVSSGATGYVHHNFVSSNVFTLQTFVSTGILLFEAGTTRTEYNTVNATDVGIFPVIAPASTTTHNHVRTSTFDGIALATDNHAVAHNRSESNNGPGIGLYDSNSNSIGNNQIANNADSGILLDGADSNTVNNNQVQDNGTPAGDTTDGIRVNAGTANVFDTNELRNNVTHDCHDFSVGNTWTNNHGETSVPPGICGPGNDTVTTADVFGWDPSYPWYTEFPDAADIDWASAYATVDIDALLQLLAALPVRAPGTALPYN